MAWVEPPEFLNTKTYPALRDRVVLSHMGSQKGVYNDNDFLPDIGSAGGGTGMQISLGAGDALVPASHPTLVNNGFYHVNSDAVSLATIGTAHGSLPRIDQVVLTVQDPSYDPAITASAPIIQVVPGTATSGATLDNRTGAAATLPPSSLRLADVLVRAGASSIIATDIRDRRPYSRGVFKRVVVTSGETSASSSTDVGVTAGRARCELTGDNPVEITLQGSGYTNNTGATGTYLRYGVSYYTATQGIPGGRNMLSGSFISTNEGGMLLSNLQHKSFTWKIMLLPVSGVSSIHQLQSAVGSVVFEPWIAWYEPLTIGFVSTISGGSAADPLIMTVREIMHGTEVIYPVS